MEDATVERGTKKWQRKQHSKKQVDVVENTGLYALQREVITC